MTSVVIPAHNEAASIGRLLEAIGPGLEVVVVANGCTDDTASLARAHGATVLDTPVPSKIAALALGDAVASTFPRIYIDGDVLITRADLDALCSALGGHVRASGPQRTIPLGRASWLVRAWYRLWEHLPGVRAELYGRGVLAVDLEGHRRIRDWPQVFSDDLHVAMSFDLDEVAVVPEAHVVIEPPHTYRDLVRRRLRIMAGNEALCTQSPRPVRPSGASLGSVAGLARREPGLAPAAMVFCITGLISKVGTKPPFRAGHGPWLRDESSRSALAG